MKRRTRLVQAHGGLMLGVARASDAKLVRRYAQQQGCSFSITLDHAPLAAALASPAVVPLTATIDRRACCTNSFPARWPRTM